MMKQPVAQIKNIKIFLSNYSQETNADFRDVLAYIDYLRESNENWQASMDRMSEQLDEAWEKLDHKE